MATDLATNYINMQKQLDTETPAPITWTGRNTGHWMYGDWTGKKKAKKVLKNHKDIVS